MRSVRIEGGPPVKRWRSRTLNGALTFTGSIGVRVSDCQVTCPDANGKAQTCITVRRRR